MTGQTLDLVQRRPAMLAQDQVLLLQLTQPIADAGFRAWCVDDRQRVDEQADHLLGACQFRRTARYGHPERDCALPRMPPQQLRPRTLKERVERHPFPLRK
jgi:hypothetical protein